LTGNLKSSGIEKDKFEQVWDELIDPHKKGDCNLEEWQLEMASLGVLVPWQLEDVFELIDVNNCGFIDKGDFVRAMMGKHENDELNLLKQAVVDLTDSELALLKKEIQATNEKIDSSIKWAVSDSQKAKSDKVFYSLDVQAGRVSGWQIMNIMNQSQLSRNVLEKVWDLADIDEDGKMDHEEFALCRYLINMAKDGVKLPDTLPVELVPPGKRHLVEPESLPVPIGPPL